MVWVRYMWCLKLPRNMSTYVQDGYPGLHHDLRPQAAMGIWANRVVKNGMWLLTTFPRSRAGRPWEPSTAPADPDLPLRSKGEVYDRDVIAVFDSFWDFRELSLLHYTLISGLRGSQLNCSHGHWSTDISYIKTTKTIITLTYGDDMEFRVEHEKWHPKKTTVRKMVA
jgi:hypothetical protein